MRTHIIQAWVKLKHKQATWHSHTYKHTHTHTTTSEAQSKEFTVSLFNRETPPLSYWLRWNRWKYSNEEKRETNNNYHHSFSFELTFACMLYRLHTVDLSIPSAACTYVCMCACELMCGVWVYAWGSAPNGFV